MNFPADGNYNLSFIAATAETSDSAVRVYIDGVVVAEGNVFGTTLNNFVEIPVASDISVSAGTRTVRLEAVGSVLKWHWFLDSFTFSPSN